MATLPSFAQGKEDLLVLFLLDYRRDGYYVDVGCFHPVNLSNTWLPYLNGWRGLCVDPNPGLASLFAEHRPRDVFEPCAVGGRSASTATFHLGNHPVHSSLVCGENSSGDTLEVAVEPLQTLFERHGVSEIDLLSVDAEGAEVEILDSFDWNQYSPRLVLVEYNSAGEINPELQPLMIRKGYQVLFINNWNILFTPEFSTDSLKLHGFQQEGKLFPPIQAKIHPSLRVEKTRETWENRGYVMEPGVSFVIQSHNSSDSVLKLVEQLSQVSHSEIIVIDDGSDPFHSERILDAMPRGNQMVLRTNDLYEVITYDRALNLARGQWVCLLQDDDSFTNCDWVLRAIELFSTHSDLVILGGRLALKLLPFEQTADGKIGEYEQIGNRAQIPNLMKKELGVDRRFPEQFQFASVVVRAPMWVNRKLYIDHLKEIDQSYAPFLVDDHDLCFRAWKAGLKVGYYPAGFTVQGLATGGMRLWNNNLTKEQAIRNYRKFYSDHGSSLEEIELLVERANKQLYSSS